MQSGRTSLTNARVSLTKEVTALRLKLFHRFILPINLGLAIVLRSISRNHGPGSFPDSFLNRAIAYGFLPYSAS